MSDDVGMSKSCVNAVNFTTGKSGSVKERGSLEQHRSRSAGSKRLKSISFVYTVQLLMVFLVVNDFRLCVCIYIYVLLCIYNNSSA